MKNNKLMANKIGILILSFNSVETIRETVRSVNNFASQIVVVDSGSTDGTVELASKMGCEIYFKKWTNNFAEQRNYAMKHIRTEWILMLDSDEYLSKFDIKEFTELSSNPKIGGININIKNLVDNSSALFYHRYTRLFRNNKLFKFEGKIHEQIRASIEEANFDIYDSDFEITHSGYNELNDNKIDRNLKLLNEELINDPNNDFIKYHIASTYFAKGELIESKNIFLELINSFQLSSDQIDMVYIRLAQISLRSDDYNSVTEFTRRMPSDRNLLGLRNYILSAVKLVINDFDAAHQLLVDENTQNSTLINKELLNQTIVSLQKIRQVRESRN